MLNSLRKVFNSRYSALILIFFFVVIFWLVGNLGNFSLLWQFLKTYGIFKSFILSFKLLGSWQTNFTLLGSVVSLLSTLLFSLNLTLLFFYWNRTKNLSKGSIGIGAGGVLGALGIGCASCGSVILASLFSGFGGVAILSVLPFGGLEFGIIGLFILIFSNLYLLKKIADPLVC